MIARLKRSRAQEQSGFTLIELLIVIIILGILAAIVVFAVGTTRKDSVASSCRTNAKAIQLDLEAINTKTGSYPTTQAAAIDPTQGALLSTWPVSSDYTFTMAGTATAYSVTLAAAGGSAIPGGTITATTTDATLKTACTAP